MTITSRIKKAGKEVMAKRSVMQLMANREAARQGLRVTYFEVWHPALDEALKAAQSLFRKRKG